MSKTPMASSLLQPIVGLPSGEIIKGNPTIVNYTDEVLRNPLDTKDASTRAAISLLPDAERFLVETHANRSPDLFKLSERSLITRMDHAGFKVSSTENLLRNRFWLEYDHAISGGFPEIRISEVIRGVCSFKFFRETFLSSSYLVAYLMLPPINFKTKQEETLMFGLDKMREILDLNAVGVNGQVDTKILRAQMAVYQILEKRVQGETVQKIAHAHALVPLSPSSQKEVDELSEEQMLLRMQELLDRQKQRHTTKAALSDVFVTKATPYKGSDDLDE
jgi:hypothetical protein